MHRIGLAGLPASISRRRSNASTRRLAAVQRNSADVAQCTDWAVFLTLRNGQTNNTPFQEQGSAYQTTSVGAKFNRTTVTGYGADGGNPNAAIPAIRTCNNCSATNTFGTSMFNLVQQSATGNTTSLFSNNQVYYATHTCGGNSGSPLLQPRIVGGQRVMRIAGIHVGSVRGAQCGIGAGGIQPNNVGTNISFAGLQNGMTAVCNLCDVNDDKSINNADIALINRNLGQAPAGLLARGDADNDGALTVNDLRLCSLLCTNRNCH